MLFSLFNKKNKLEDGADMFCDCEFGQFVPIPNYLNTSYLNNSSNFKLCNSPVGKEGLRGQSFPQNLSKMMNTSSKANRIVLSLQIGMYMFTFCNVMTSDHLLEMTTSQHLQETDGTQHTFPFYVKQIFFLYKAVICF